MSEFIDGALAFRATLDIDDFDVSAESMERHIQRVSTTAVQEAEKMDNAFSKAAAAFIGIVGVNQAAGFVKNMIQVRSEMQNVEASFKVFLGSAEKAEAFFDRLNRYAYNNVFEFADLSKSAAQLLAFRTDVEDVIPTINKLSEIAAGTNVPLSEMVSLFNKAKANDKLLSVDIQMWESRGVPLVYEMANAMNKGEDEIRAMVSAGKIGFKELNDVIDKVTTNGGMFAGMMVEKMKTLGDSIGLLQDNITNMFNSLGEANHGILKAGIDSASYLVEHYEEVGRILGSLVTAYGTYKAAVIATSLATKGNTGVSIIDNTVKSVKLTLLKMEETATGKTAAQIAAMTKAEVAHTAALEAKLTAEEKSNLVKSIRIATIQGLLTAQQQEYLSNLGITTSSQNYEAVAMSVLSVEQRMALSKIDLSSKSSIYRAALESEVAAKTRGTAATLEAMRTDVRAAAVRVESAKQTAIATMQATEAARYEVYWAKQSGDATRIATAEKKFEAAVENQSLARKAALSSQTDFYTKKKQLEAAATKQATVAGIADTTSKGAQSAATSLLTTITTKCTAALKTLWASMMTNPIGWIIGIVGALVSVFTLFKNKQDETNDAMGEFQETTKKEIDNLNLLMAVLRNTEKGTNAHKQALDKVNAILKEYNKELITESTTVEGLKDKYDELTESINASAAARVKAKYIEKIQQEQTETQEDAKKDLRKSGNKLKTYVDNPYGEYGYWESVQSIRKMNEAVYDQIEIMAIESANKLKNLTGDAYTQGFNKSLQNISNSVKAASGASDKDMQVFSTHLRKYLSAIVESEKDVESKTNDLIASMEAFANAGGSEPEITKTVDYAVMSFSELDKLVKETQTEIDEINAKEIKIDTDNTRLTELLGILSQVKQTIDGKEDNLNTEAGISARIKQLKEERENVEINGKKYNELTQKINSLQSRIPDNSKNAGENAIKKQEQLADKQLQADFRLEQARIEIMEEGYAKRKAQLDLQHRMNLANIEKEQKDLEKARKEAGAGGLSDDDKKDIAERKELENKSYAKAENSLFDGEIEYKKKQYELYFRWVKNLGKDVADKQFSELLKDGNSYKEYIDKKIQELSQKKAAGTITEGEGNHLIALNMQYDEITGAKTAMDSFKESVTRAISQASTLAEKIEAIANAKEKLAAGGNGLVGEDEHAEASLFVSNAEDDVNKELEDKILNDFQTFEEAKLAIQDEYALLRRVAMEQNNAELLAQINKGEAEALSALNAQMLMQTDSWNNLFTDLDALTIEQIDKLVTEIQEKMNTADLDLNPADLKAVLDRLDEAKQRILDVNPFKALGKAIGDVFKKTGQGSKKETGEIKRDWSNLAKATQGTFDFVNDAIDSCDVLGDLIGDTGKETIAMVQGIAMAGIAMATAISTAEKGSVILTAISIALQAIQWIASLFNNDNKLEERIQNIQKNIDALENSFDRLQHAVDQTYWIYSEEEKTAHDNRIQAINEEIAALEKQAIVAVQSWNFVKYAELTKQIKELKYALEKEENKGDMFQLYDLQRKNLEEQQRLIEQQIQAEKEKKKTDWDKIAGWEEAIKDIDTQLEDLEREMLITLAGTDIKSAIDEFADALVDAYVKGEDAAKALGEVTKDVMKKAVVEAIKKQFLAKAINDAVLYLGESMKDGKLDDSERAKFESMVNAAGEATSKALEAVGDWIKDLEDDVTEDPLTGAVRSLSEETGGVIAGRLNAFVINQSDQTAIMRQSLLYQQEIAMNTRYNKHLEGILEALKRMETKDNSLLSQGIS
ncbi:hypothetical protein M2451_002562 [Dysgonomonas sp. PFB1-18]|uniref:tape measure protein n=1 Tax=unclassified Dysgonomonas TaxID=2630389 RepID=UPI002475E87F|nr:MULTISPECIES: tape measure protein [unclassified Dysgonomonas]MDH6308043.1 hypothetical protein [Dysgonomonas sp. PF1-14]MDH6339582.1 hypothetical protein [Dysgonomonas sp. PF1-16]MDH6381233.1 hypothetical protein [Dysgonomonas sp. PFB1-18]MDH6398445.1 hypothetical protein [Dysgonomonas sp. PF1-23]